VSEESRAIAELIERGSWAALTVEDRMRFTSWARRILARPWDLFIFLVYVHERWSRPRRSSSTTMHAIDDTADKDPDPDGS